MAERELSPQMLQLLGKILEYEDVHGAHEDGWVCFRDEIAWVKTSDIIAARAWAAAKKYYQGNKDQL